MDFLLIIVCMLLPLVNALEFNQGQVDEALKQAIAAGGSDPLKKAGDLVFGEEAYTNPPTGEPLPKPSGLGTPTLDDATYYVHFAAAAYCEGPLLADWTCEECKKVDATVEMVKVFTNEARGTQAYIAKNPPNKEFILVFRGTHNLPNLMDDFNWELVDSGHNDGVRIHHGDNLALMSIYKDILEELTQLSKDNPDFHIVITGHSLGGAMSALAYYHLNHDLSGKDYAVFTYGQPRAGDKAFADYINAQSIPFARVVNKADLVPHLMPYTVGFLHHVTEYWTQADGTTRTCANDVYEDPTCSNSEPKAALNAVDHVHYLGTEIKMQCV